ncbi:MAG TPA: hypothetical protein VNS88_16400 [Nitrospiraceae bacterium]|nr:hypothetical protein [Nitrospiraceae bacterium]
MTVHQLPKTGLIKQDFKDKQWQVPLNQGLDNWESRVGVAGGVDPQGVAQGFYIGQTFYNTATGILWFCTTPGSTTTTIWSKMATDAAVLNYNNYVELASGGVINPTHHRKFIGYGPTVAGSWSMQSGGFLAGWTCEIACYNAAGGSVTIIAAPGHPFITVGARLNQLSLNFPDAGELYTPDGVSFIWRGDRHYTSPNFPLNAGTQSIFSHNLGVNAQRVIFRLNNIAADLGYVPGDMIHMNSDTQSANYGALLKSSATQLAVKIAVAGLQLLDWNTGITAPADLTKWTGNIRGDAVN